MVSSTINWVDQSTPPSTPGLRSNQGIQILTLTQGNSSISKYFENVKSYAMLTGKDLNDVEVKEKFLVGLSPDNRKRAEEFGYKKPLKVIVKYLVRDPTLSTEIQKYKAGELKQGNESVRAFLIKLERLRKLSKQARCDEKDLREKLFCGISSINQDELIPEKLIEGRNGQGNLDYAVECRSTGRVLGVIEVKKEDFMKGFAQASVQMESTLSRKCKADEIDNGQDVDRVFGIVTDASEWYFMECSLDNEGKPAFKLSESVTVVYKDENLQAKVEKVLRHIVWILEEAQKPVEASQSGVKRSLSIPPKEKRPQEVLDSVTQPCNSATSEASAINAPLLDQKLLDSKYKKGKSVDKLKQELFFPETTDSLGETNELSTEQNHVTKISETLCPGKLNLLRKQRSQETGLQLRDVSRDSLRKKTQRAEK
ncbi:14295_t:CDS:2, partial [Funneliformis geosporum]